MSKQFQILLKFFINACLAVAIFCSHGFAASCNLQDSDFPSDECPFSDLGANTEKLRFGQIDSAFPPGGPIFVRFGTAIHRLADPVTLHEVDSDDGDCDTESANAGDSDLDELEPGEDVAFITSSSDPREIIEIWILNCNVVQAR